MTIVLWKSEKRRYHTHPDPTHYTKISFLNWPDRGSSPGPMKDGDIETGVQAARPRRSSKLTQLIHVRLLNWFYRVLNSGRYQAPAVRLSTSEHCMGASYFGYSLNIIIEFPLLIPKPKIFAAVIRPGSKAFKKISCCRTAVERHFKRIYFQIYTRLVIWKHCMFTYAGEVDRADILKH